MPEISNLFLYKMLFMLNLIIAQSLFLFRLRKRPNYEIRMLLCTTLSFIFAFFFPILGYNALYSSFMFSTFFALTVLTTKLCYDIDWRTCIFCTVAGYSVQHLASVCYDMIITLSGFNQGVQLYSNTAVSVNPLTALISIQVYALVYWVLFHLFGSKIRRNEDLAMKSPILLALVVLIALVEIVLNAFVIYRKYDNLDMAYYLAASLTNIICTLSVLVIQFELLLRKSLENELGIVYQMWRQEQKQFHVTKETIDLINMKCHDLKHQIRTISQRGAIDQATLEEIEETITIYDSIAKTGNQALDIILAEKSLYCSKNGIFVSYMIDGEKLNFMGDSDIYSLFGNLLDNAIKTVIQLEPDQRVIGITIKAEGELLSINSHNYYSGEVQMEHGIPVTASPDKNYHGFGVKSMIMIVEKYGGNIVFNARDNVFNLNILFPLSGTDQPAAVS
jgi:signal transduction histidine kinase